MTVFNSMQRPKRIEVVASNGRSYYFLCKKDDDLRKDARVMEFNALINRLLHQVIRVGMRACVCAHGTMLRALRHDDASCTCARTTSCR